jgi:hypothetical protein
MKKKVIRILICILFITISISSVTGNLDENESVVMENIFYNNIIKHDIESLIISKNNWSEQAKLIASDAEEDESFGYSLSIDGYYAIIGAHYDDDNGFSSGSAYIFIRSGTSWTQQAKLLASDGAEMDLFGFTVAIDGDYVIIGAHEDDDIGSNSGSVYIFKRDGTAWTENAKLVASDGDCRKHFGCSVSMNNDYVIVGSYGDEDNGQDSGSAYIFKRNGTTWTQQAKILPSDGAEEDLFGYSVSLDNDTAIIGAHQDDDNGQNSGSAYIFKRNGTTWTQQAKILPSDGALNDYFGYSVSLDSDTAIIGAHQDNDNGQNSGSAYIFKHNGTTWTQQAKILPSDGSSDDSFGVSVSIDGHHALFGAYGDDYNGEDSGSAYVFTKDNGGNQPNLSCDGALNWADIEAGDLVEGEIIVWNSGDDSSELNWEIKSYPNWGNWTFTPSEGDNLLPNYPVTISVTVIAPNEPEEIFSGEVKIINSEDINNHCIIDVSLTTPVNQYYQSFPLIHRLMERYPDAFPILRNLLEK